MTASRNIRTQLRAPWPPSWVLHQPYKNKITSTIPYATQIPQLLVGVDRYWVKDSNDWPDWKKICNPDRAELETHEWWPRVAIDGSTGKTGESSKSVLGKRKAEEPAQKESEGKGGEDMVEGDGEEDVRWREKVEGKKKAKEDNDEDYDTTDVKYSRSRQRRRLEDGDEPKSHYPPEAHSPPYERINTSPTTQRPSDGSARRSQDL